jgi:hypothetical protein
MQQGDVGLGVREDDATQHLLALSVALAQVGTWLRHSGSHRGDMQRCTRNGEPAVAPLR